MEALRVRMGLGFGFDVQDLRWEILANGQFNRDLKEVFDGTARNVDCN